MNFHTANTPYCSYILSDLGSDLTVQETREWHCWNTACFVKATYLQWLNWHNKSPINFLSTKAWPFPFWLAVENMWEKTRMINIICREGSCQINNLVFKTYQGDKSKHSVNHLTWPRLILSSIYLSILISYYLFCICRLPHDANIFQGLEKQQTDEWWTFYCMILVYRCYVTSKQDNLFITDQLSRSTVPVNNHRVKTFFFFFFLFRRFHFVVSSSFSHSLYPQDLIW